MRVGRGGEGSYLLRKEVHGLIGTVKSRQISRDIRTAI